MHYRELSTPALIVDLDVMERNLDRMAAYCRKHDIGLRPHTKTHKTIEIAQMQIERGALGLTVAKVGEAEVMAGAAPKQILVAHPIFGKEQLRRLCQLALEAEVLIAIDDESTAVAISRAAAESGCTLGVLVEFDAGSHRCGLPPGPRCVDLARQVDKLACVRMRGVMTYFGSVWGGVEERSQGIKAAACAVEQALEAFQQARMPLEIVSGGSTPSAFLSHQVPGLSEIRPGTYVFNDMNTFYQEACELGDCAARILTTVISTAVPEQAVLDAGSKTFSHDPLSSGSGKGYGYVVEEPAAELFRLNEEHGYLNTSKSRRFHVGEVLTVIPNHVCTCVNMHDEMFLVRNEQVVGTWKVAARGKIR